MTNQEMIDALEERIDGLQEMLDDNGLPPELIDSCAAEIVALEEEIQLLECGIIDVQEVTK